MNSASRAYPTILKKTEEGYSVFVPDLDIVKEGRDIKGALNVVKEAITNMIVKFDREGKRVPCPHSTEFVHDEDDILTLVEVNFKELIS